MNRIRLQFALSDKQQQDQIVEDLQKQISNLGIGVVRVRPERPRLTGSEVLEWIGVAIVVTRASRTLIEELLEIAKLIMDKYEGIKGGSVGVRQAQVPVSQVTDAQIDQVVRDLQEQLPAHK